MRQLIEDALSANIFDANAYFNLYCQLERMVEAAYPICERERVVREKEKIEEEI